MAKQLAISYLRCSTPEQAQGDSIRRQIEAAEEYARKHGFDLDRSITFHDEGLSGYSGANRRKGKLRLLLDRTRQGLIPKGTALLVENIDRLSREHPLDSFELIKELVSAGIQIHTIANGRVYTDESLRSDFTSMLLLTFELGRGCGESDRKSYLLLQTWKQKRSNLAQKKLTSICPQWLQLDETRTAFHLNETRAEIVRMIFRLSNQGWGKRRIAAELNRTRVETWGRGESKADAWHPSYVSKILHNRAVLGEFQPHRMADGKRTPDGPVITDYFPAVVGLATFESANRKRISTGGQTQKKISNLFAGLVYEGGTEYRMVYADKGKHKRQNHASTRYLRSDRHRVQPDAEIPAWNYSEFENVVLRVLREINWNQLRDQKRPARQLQLEHELAVLDAQVRKLSDSIERILAAIANEPGETPAAPMAAIRHLEAQRNTKEAIASAKREELRIEEESHINIASNLDTFKNLLAVATNPHEVELRLQVREEIRRKVRRIELYQSEWPTNLQRARPWLNPSYLFILFANGGARVVYIQPTGRGKAPDLRIADAPNGSSTEKPFPAAA
jgi:DNA invertase Pin-like site-specific DNA recombinase